ncbi:hypothetical protein [Pontitalea aquivivens]|uniref:hypothetical protein n=1 Tax=Pontitalea aquivivens TaxID=3388663 RepID=UPI0039708B6B
MLRLDLSQEPGWLDLMPGVRVQLRPLSTALMVAVQRDPAVRDLPDDAPEEVRAVAAAKALARRAILAWEGVGDGDGQPIPVTPEGIDALLEIWPIFEAFQSGYVARALLLDAEKNASSPLPTGTLEGASATATPAKGRARTARRG